MNQRSHHHHRHFPRPIARFLQLEGGQYGTVDLLALTAHRLEMQLGGDFVQFSRKQAEDMRDALQMFIDLGAERPPPRPGAEGEVVEEIEEDVEMREAVVEVVPRRRRGRRS